MKHKKVGVNQCANRCEPFHQKKTIFGIDMYMMWNFKPQEWSIYKQAIEAEATQGWSG